MRTLDRAATFLSLGFGFLRSEPNAFIHDWLQANYRFVVQQRSPSSRPVVPGINSRATPPLWALAGARQNSLLLFHVLDLPRCCSTELQISQPLEQAADQTFNSFMHDHYHS